MEPPAGSVPIGGVRLCLWDREGKVRKVARLNWNNHDTSLYITAYCPPGGRAFAGRLETPLGEQSISWDETSHLQAGETMPKLSLHESGNTKTEVGGRKVKFVVGQELFHAQGGHIATITATNVEYLPELTKKAKGTEMDLIAENGPKPWTSVRFPIYIHSSPDENLAHQFRLAFQRPHLPSPVHVGIDPIGSFDDQHDPNGGGGVLVCGGWGPAIRPSQVTEIAFIATKT
jgi:hypothetical protein